MIAKAMMCAQFKATTKQLHQELQQEKHFLLLNVSITQGNKEINKAHNHKRNRRKNLKKEGNQKLNHYRTMQQDLVILLLLAQEHHHKKPTKEKNV
eukprot:10492033-Ditylum_brightwellii.AAC.1